MASAAVRQLQRVQEREDLLFLRRREFVKASLHVCGLALVALDGVRQREGFEIVHEARSHAQAPKRSRPQLVGGVQRGILYDTITSSHAVEQEVAERMNDFIPQSVGHDKGSTVYYRPGRSGRDAFDVARITTDPVE